MREVKVDLEAIKENYRVLKSVAKTSTVMAVVKADGYGHGAIEVAKALESIGVDYLGVADLAEALALRKAGINSKLMCWLFGIDVDFAPAVDHDVEIGISTMQQLEKLQAVSGAKVHFKIDTGLSRNGFTISDFKEALDAIKTLVAGGNIIPVGIFTHLSNTNQAEDEKQFQLFEQAADIALQAGIEIPLRHACASAATLNYPTKHYEMVRCGIAVYGLSPDGSDVSSLPLTPAMTVSSQVVNIKKVPAGSGVSYDYRYRTTTDTTLALVPFGYGDGLPRTAVDVKILIAGKEFRVSGRIAMDQFVVDVGDSDIKLGDPVEIISPANPADALAKSTGTINYEIVTRMGMRPGRSYSAGDQV